MNFHKLGTRDDNVLMKRVKTTQVQQDLRIPLLIFPRSFLSVHIHFHFYFSGDSEAEGIILIEVQL